MSLLPVLIGLVSGILLSSIQFFIPVYAYIMYCILILLVWLFVDNRYVWIAAIALSIGMISLYRNKPLSDNCAINLINRSDNKKIYISGWINEPVGIYPDKERLLLKIERVNGGITNADGCLIQITVITKNGQNINYFTGDYITVYTKPRKPLNYKNPGSFDYIAFLERKGISLVGYINDPALIQKNIHRSENSVIRMIDVLRLSIKDAIELHVKGQAPRGIIEALVIGEQGFVSQDIRKAFASTGIIHIIVVSGLHLAIISHIFYLFFKLLLSRLRYLCLHTNIPKLSLIFTIFPAFAFVLISGANLPVIRSFIMITVYIVLFVLNRNKARWNALFLSALIILLVEPYALYSVSFQLSFLSVGSIIAFGPLIKRLSENMPKLKKHILGRGLKGLIGMLCVSLFVTIGLSGVLVYYFNTLPLFGILLNVIIIPLFGYIILPLSFLSSLTGIIMPQLSNNFFSVLSLIINLSVEFVKAASNLSYASITLPTPDVSELVLYYTIVLLFLNIKRIGSKFTIIGVSITALAMFLDAGACIYKTHYNKELSITFLDVRQGDSALIEFPYGRTMLIDGGGSFSDNFDIGESVVARYIWSLKRTSIDYAVASHPQSDHIGGLGFIIKCFKPKDIYKNDCDPDTVVYNNLDSAIKHSNAVLHVVDAYTSIKDINGAKVEFFIIPHDNCLASQKAINNTAIITKITYKKVSILFTGDIEKDAEFELAGLYGDKISATILKAAHHGSNTSNTGDFIDAVKPSIVIISVGEGNAFRMPAKAVLKRFFKKDVRVFRTDRSGAIKVTTDGEKIHIVSYIK